VPLLTRNGHGWGQEPLSLQPLRAVERGLGRSARTPSARFDADQTISGWREVRGSNATSVGHSPDKAERYGL